MSAHSGDDKYDDIQSRLTAAKRALESAAPGDRDAVTNALAAIEAEAQAYASDLHERMRQEQIRQMMNRFFRK